MKKDNITELFKKALGKGKARDYKKSAEILTEILSRTDNFPPAFLYLGRCYHSLGDINRAIQLLKYYTHLKPGSGIGYFFLGRSYLAAGNFRLSTYYLKKAVYLNPQFGYAYGLLGLSYLKQKRYTHAITSFKKALNINPGDLRILNAYLNSLTVYGIKLFYKRYYNDSVEIFEFILKYNAYNTVAHLYLASLYRELEKPEKALKHLDYVLSITPIDPALRLNRAIILIMKGNIQEAIKEIKYISVLLNTNANMGQNPEELYRILINVLFEQKKYHETIYYAEKLLKKNYHQSHLHSIIAEAYRNIGDFKKARNHFIRAVNDNRKIIEYHYGLSMVLWQMKAYKELQKELDIILYKNPKDEIARYYYALVLAKTGADKTTTLSHLQVEVKKHGPDPELMCSLGTQYLKLDLPELAAGWFERTLKLDPACKEALLSLISISAKTGETIKQFSYLQQYLKVFPNDIPVKKKYIKLLLKTGRYGEAAKQIMEILPIETENMKLKETLAVCYRKEGNFFDALLIYMELLRKNPKSGRLLQAVSFCKIQLGATEDAIRLLEKASSFVKNNSTLLLTLGALYYRTQNYEEALRVLRKVTEVSPRSWQAYEGLSRVYNRLGNKIFADKFKERANEYKILIS